LPGQPETNPRGHNNAVFGIGEGFEESLVIVLQESVLVPDSVGADVQKEEEKLSSIKKVNLITPVYSYQSLVPYPQRLAWAKLFQLEPRFVRFLDVLKWVYADTPFLEALKKVLA